MTFADHGPRIWTEQVTAGFNNFQRFLDLHTIGVTPEKAKKLTNLRFRIHISQGLPYPAYAVVVQEEGSACKIDHV
jgi:hypothetical protein